MTGLSNSLRITSALSAVALHTLAACSAIDKPDNATASAMEQVRAIERERLNALVAANQVTLERLHAADFQAISPLGSAFPKRGYIDSVVSGQLDYVRWEPEQIQVRMYGRVAAIRYRARVDVTARGHRFPTMETWNTGLYELRAGRWAIVWFQVTQISPSP